MDQRQFLAYVLGEAPGYIEVATADVAFNVSPSGVVGEETFGHTWAQYPLADPLVGENLVFRPVVVPEPNYDLARNGVVTHAIASGTHPGYTPLLPPSVTVPVDEGHTDAYWHLAEPLPYHDAEELRRKLDPLGAPQPYLWLPGTITSDTDPPHMVLPEEQPTLRTWRLGEVKKLDPPIMAPTLSLEDVFWEPDIEVMGGDGTVAGVQAYLAARLGDEAGRVGTFVSRPKTPFDKTVLALLDRGLAIAEVIWIAFHTAANPYRSRRYTARWETACHVARLAASVMAPGAEIMRQVNGLRARGGKPYARQAMIADTIYTDMQKRGRFAHCFDKTYWYIDRYTGEPIELGERNERLAIFIANTYGINPVDTDHKAVVKHLITKTGVMPRSAETTSLSFYRDGARPEDRQLWVHFGGREIGLLTVDGLAPDPNGNSGLVFQLPSEADPIVTTNLRTDVPTTWWDDFLPPQYFQSLDGVDPVHASVLMRIWLQFVLFRNVARTRPILAFVGPIQSGKSTTARRFYTLLYGGRKELTSIDTAREYDTLTSNNPFVVFDNLDHCPTWLPTRLELSITPREQDRRKLFTDNTLYHIKCDAIVGLTAHDPSIFREGIIDRMLVLTFRRLTDDEKLPEGDMYRELVDRREEFLSGLMSDALRILRTPRVPFRDQGWETTIRVVDFVNEGYWFAQALGILPEFREAVTALKKRQTRLIVEGEGTLVDALIEWAGDRDANEWRSASQLWNELTSVAPDPQMFQTLYKTPAVLGGKLASVYAQLKDVTGLEYYDDPVKARRVWRIRPEKKAEES